ncbi:hypothetical protein JXA34_02595 [Patescibacteria group bacterium]|nr:hypothetical protein [Patescibacteria group bacterium]
MQKKNLLTLFSFFSLILLLLAKTYAADFSLTEIGALNTGGATYSDWWYTGVNPTLTGTGEADTEVKVKVDGDSHETTADGSGNWSLSLTLAAGDYSIELSQGDDSYSFTLHLGQNLPADLGGSGTSETSESTGTVPETGFNQFIGVTMSAGVLLLGFYLYVWGNPKVQAAIEKRLIKD